MQADGPDVNVIKLKPPLPFSKVSILSFFILEKVKGASLMTSFIFNTLFSYVFIYLDIVCQRKCFVGLL